MSFKCFSKPQLRRNLRSQPRSQPRSQSRKRNRFSKALQLSTRKKSLKVQLRRAPATSLTGSPSSRASKANHKLRQEVQVVMKCSISRLRRKRRTRNPEARRERKQKREAPAERKSERLSSVYRITKLASSTLTLKQRQGLRSIAMLYHRSSLPSRAPVKVKQPTSSRASRLSSPNDDTFDQNIKQIMAM